MKTFFKKPIAVVLAMLIVLSSVAAGVYALSLDDSGTLDVYTRFYLKSDNSGVEYDGEDTCSGTLSAKKGDTVVAKLSFSSQFDEDDNPDDGEENIFNVYQLALLFSYDNTVLTMKNKPELGDTKSYASGTILGTCTLYQGSIMASKLGLSNEGTEYIYFVSNFIKPTGVELDKDTNGKDLATLEFTVNSDASFSAADFKVVPESILENGGDVAVTPTYVSSYDSIDKIDSDLFNLTINSYSEKVSIAGTVNYNTGDKGTIATSGTITSAGDGVYTQSGENGATVTVPTVTVNQDDADKYTFKGWALEANGNVLTDAALADVVFKGTNADTLYAIYEGVKYNAIYVADGEEFDKIEVPYGEAIETPANEPASVTGKTFTGWKDVEGKTPADYAEGMPANDVTFTAQFDIAKSTLTYVLDNGESNVVFEEVEFGTDISDKVPADPTKSGYTFAGWDKTSTTMPAEDYTVTAQWTADDNTITYVVDGETYTTETYKTDAEITPVTAPTKEGYTFSGWSEIPTTMPAGGVTVTGTFTADDQTIVYYVDGEVYTTETYKTDATITPANEPTKDGYTFSGWDNVPATMPAGGATVNGSFTANDQEIVYYVDGEEYARESYKTGEAITPVAEPTKDGYTFGGWSEIPATMPAGGAYVDGAFTADDQEIIYYVDGEEYTRETYKTDATITPVDEPTKANYTFSGWSEIPTTMPVGGVTVTGTFTENEKYTVTYVDENGATVAEIVGYEGDTVTAPAVPAKDGYEGAWAEDVATIPAANKTVEPVYTAKKSAVTFKDEDGNDIGGSDPVEVPYDTPIGDSAPEAPEKPGQDFDTWVDQNGNPVDPEKSLEEQGIPYTEDLVLTPSYKVTDKFIIANGVAGGTITYDEANPITVSGKEGETYTVPDAVAPEYADILEFVEWERVKASNVPGTFEEEGRTFKAVYTIKEYAVTYKDADGSEIVSTKVPYAGDIQGTQPADPTAPEGKIFKGWKDADGKAPTDYTEMPAKDVTFTAVYEDEIPDTYTATFTSVNALGQPVTVGTFQGVEGADIEAPADPTRFGYKFVGWKDADGKALEDYTDGMPANDVTFEAQWEQDVNFMPLVIGGVVVSGVVVGSALAANAALITTGAIVGGAVIIGGAAIAAKYTHKVTYYVDGDVYRVFYILEGTKVIVPSDPKKAGSTFTGWDKEIPNRMPANDLEFHATFDGRVASDVNGVIPDTGSSVASISALAIIASAAAAAYVVSTRKKEDEE